MAEDPQSSLVIRQDHGPVRRLMMNRPAAHNSLTVAMTKALLEALAQAQADPEVRALIISGSGSSFCAGGDLKELLAQGEAIGDYIDQAMRDCHNPLILNLSRCRMPVVCAVNGAAVGAGVGLALAGDFCLASDTTQFHLPFVPSLGIVPDAGCSWFLSQALGYRRALGHILSGEPLSAETAHQAGLVWACVDPEELEARALTLAQQLARLPAVAATRARGLLAAAHDQDLETQLAMEHRLQCESFLDAPAREGLAAIRERRSPDFTRVHSDA